MLTPTPARDVGDRPGVRSSRGVEDPGRARTVGVLCAGLEDGPRQRLVEDAIDEAGHVRRVGPWLEPHLTVRAAAVFRPDVVLIGADASPAQALLATRRITSGAATVTGCAAPAVVVVTSCVDGDFVYTAVRSGARAITLMGPEEPPLGAVLRGAGCGVPYLPVAAMEEVVRDLTAGLLFRRPARGAELSLLTRRELEVMTLVGRGLTNADICTALFLSEDTVKTHVRHIHGKLGVSTRADVVVLAYEHGLVVPGRALDGSTGAP